MKSKLVLNFIKGDAVPATITIACDSPASDSKTVKENLPPYIDYDASVNINWIASEDMIDGMTPIQVISSYTGNLPPILLLEETDYQIRIERKLPGLDIDRELEYLMKNGNSLYSRKSMFDDDSERICIYSFRSRSYVGKGYFNIIYQDEELRIPFEIRSKKISYLQDYPKMLADIAEFYTAVLMQSTSPVFSDYHLTDSPAVSLYEDFMLLEYLFNKMDLPGLFAYISSNLCTEIGISHQ